MPKGGHFAAWEQPELLSHEIIQFFGPSSGFERPETVSGAQEIFSIPGLARHSMCIFTHGGTSTILYCILIRILVPEHVTLA